MPWTIEFAEPARKALRKLDRQVADRIIATLEEIAALDDPKIRGKPLVGPRLAGLWRYRVGDWRIIAKIEGHRLTIIVVTVGNRREISE